MFQVSFFSSLLAKFFAKIDFNFFIFFIIKIKSFEFPKSTRNYEKNDAWNIRRLVDESFVPSTQRIILNIVRFLFSGAFVSFLVGLGQKSSVMYNFSAQTAHKLV